MVSRLGGHGKVQPDCELYTRWEGKLSPVMRQRHPAGERLFVDYAGPTVDVVCPKTGEVRTAQIFVATLGASITPMLRPAELQMSADITLNRKIL